MRVASLAVALVAVSSVSSAPLPATAGVHRPIQNTNAVEPVTELESRGPGGGAADVLTQGIETAFKGPEVPDLNHVVAPPKSTNPFDGPPTPKSLTPNEAVLEHHDSFSRGLSPIKTRSPKHQTSNKSQDGFEDVTSDRVVKEKVLERLASGKGEKGVETPKSAQTPKGGGTPKDVEHQKPKVRGERTQKAIRSTLKFAFPMVIGGAIVWVTDYALNAVRLSACRDYPDRPDCPRWIKDQKGNEAQYAKQAREEREKKAAEQRKQTEQKQGGYMTSEQVTSL